MNKPDYSEAYAIFDGIMLGCLGKDCPSSCCGEKTVLNHRGEPETFRTTLLDETEYDYQLGLDRKDPQLAKLGVELKPIQDIGGATAFLVKDCLDPERGCKLAAIGRKPIICRTAPLEFGNTVIAMRDCPAIREIQRLGDDELLHKIIAIDHAARFSERRFVEDVAARKN